MKKYAIEVEKLQINYRFIKSYSIKRDILKINKKRSEKFTALENISFKVETGEIVGVVGRNGSGKSTLLKAVGGIFAPDSGSIKLNNDSVSLLSLGLGFDRNLTGRENIYLSGILLGFDKKTISENINEIIEFAEIGNFVDKPVKTYSSGMYSKLAFSLSIIMKPEILLIDELLSVGDLKFRRKSFNKMKELISDKNTTVMIVSHSTSTIKQLCSKVLWLDRGKMMMYGDTEMVINEYDKYMEE